MGHQHDGDGDLLAQQRQLALQAAPGDLVHRREGLVEQQHPRLAGQCPGQRHALALATGELGRVAPGQPLQAHPGEPRLAATPPLGHRQVVQRHHDVAQRRQVRKQGVVLEHQAQAAALGRQRQAPAGIEPQRLAAGDASGGRPVEPGDAAQQGGLAAAGGAHQGQQLAGLAAELRRQGDRPRLVQADLQGSGARDGLRHGATSAGRRGRRPRRW